jgi:hypothetical protein
MAIEIIQGPTVIQAVVGKPCKECEEEKVQKDLLEETRAETDRVTLSTESPLDTGTSAGSTQAGLNIEGEDQNQKASSGAGPRTEAELSPEEKQVLDELKARDREVRAHEQAHLAAAGPYAKGPPSYEFQTGPDGQPYAVGGEVRIDTSPVAGNPEATVVKAQTIKRAATAPRNPSAQDRQVAAQAAQLEAQARQEIKEERSEKQEETSGTEKSNPAGSTENATLSQQNSQPTVANAQPGQGENSSGNFGSSPRVQNLLKNFASSSKTADKGNLLNIVS